MVMDVERRVPTHLLVGLDRTQSDAKSVSKTRKTKEERAKRIVTQLRIEPKKGGGLE